MKLLALGLAVLVSALFSKYEVVYLPDTHIDSVSAVRCDLIASDPEVFSNEFDRFLCEASQDIPYDSVRCFMSAVMLRMIDGSEPETDNNQTRGDQILNKRTGVLNSIAGLSLVAALAVGAAKYRNGQAGQAY